MPSRRTIAAALSLTLATLLGPLSFAVTTPPAGSLDAKVVTLGPLLDTTVDVQDETAPRAAFDRFAAVEAGDWRGRLHKLSGRAALLSGSGLPVMPGRGNSLPPEGVVGLEELERRVRALIERHPQLLASQVGELRLSSARSGILDGGRLAYIDFDLVLGGRLVRDARVFARINNGNLVQLGTRNLGGAADVREPVLDRDDAYARTFAWIGGQTEIDVPVGEPELYYLPVGQEPELAYRLVWEVAFERRGELQTWTARVDALSGEVLEFFDANKYGYVTGGVYPRTVTDGEIVVGMPFTNVTGAGATDRAGAFPYSGGEVSTGLDGQFFNTNCQGCSNPSQTDGRTDFGLGWLALGNGGIDETGNGASIRADRHAYFHLNFVREIAKKWLDIPWFDTNIEIRTNVNSTCNATWGGRVNVYRSGGGCNNTGEISDVLYHEWGHGIDGNTLIGDSATGEGTGDTVSFAVTHDSLIGPYFRTTGGPVRDVNKDTTAKGLITRSNASSLCGTGPCLGALGLECHCEGEIYGQTGWDLAQSLVAKHGFHTGWQVHERIFFSSLPQAGSYLDNQANAIYDAYLAADDDDGNLNNGTPNGAEIHAAFDLHEIAPNGQAPNSTPGCTRPAEPAVQITGDCAGLTLSWDAIPGATEYHVLRNEIGATMAFARIATVTGTSYVDSEVLPDQTYHYVVEAVATDGCTSTIEGIQSVNGPQRPIVGITAIATDDVPAGNRSATVDPGEAVDVSVTLENFTGISAGSLSGTISTSTPGVTIDVPTVGFPDLAGFANGQGSSAFRFSIDEAVSCGSRIDFTFSLTDDSGCTPETQYFSIDVGTVTPRQTDDFSTDNGWTFDAAGSSAVTGDWTRGAPVGTSYQPASDSGDAGDSCWYTAPNPSGTDDSDDVDGGEVVLLSPAFDLSTLASAELSYQRWYANSAPGTDIDDYFIVEASDNGGSSWQLVELLGSNDNAPAWTRVTVDLDSIIALTSDVRFRVRISDGGTSDSVVEAAFDEFRITESECDLTPPCFVPPTFAGLQGAAQGSDCAETALSWLAASSNCQNAALSYNVYRSTTPGFTPDATTRIADNLATLSFDDALLSPGVDYSYIVRAFDSRSGEESNSIELTVTAPTGPDTKAPIFAGLGSLLTGDECGETSLSWAAAQETCSTPVFYNVYRSTTPGFTPDASTLVAQTTATSLVDAGLAPNTDVYYVVRAVDQAGLEDNNSLELTAEAKVKELLVSLTDFEAGAAGFSLDGTNDAATGLWELGDPVGTDAQPDDCPSGTSCWATGLNGPGLGDNDIDTGTTTLQSPAFDLTGLIEPAVRYMRYYSNNTGSTPGTDTWLVEISNDDGANWSTVESTNVSDEGFVFSDVVFPLGGVLAPTAQMRVRFVASDLGEGSLVEAVLDDFRTVDLAGGCDGCGAPVGVGNSVLVTRDGDDVVLDWTGDPVAAGRFKVYTLSGSGFADATLLGTSAAKSYRHDAGAQLPGLTAYRISAVDACAQEGPLE